MKWQRKPKQAPKKHPRKLSSTHPTQVKFAPSWVSEERIETKGSSTV